MTKTHDYEIALAGLADWDDFLLRESGLPGPRGNLELADAFARVAGEDLMVRYAALGPDVAPTNSPQEFLAFCGVLGFGRLVAEGQRSRLADLRRAAGDPRWRQREACARALQIFGDADLAALLHVAEEWCGGSRLEQRAALAGICEPRLLREPEAARVALRLLDRVTASMRQAAGRRLGRLSRSCARAWATAGASPSLPFPMRASRPWTSGSPRATARCAG